VNSESNLKLNPLISEIAVKFLGVKNLETQYSNALDFHDLAVWTLKAALEAAFNAGYESARNQDEAK
jgi:hypothetical protein